MVKSKRFKLRVRERETRVIHEYIITVDEDDAHQLRSNTWFVLFSRQGKPYPMRYINGAHVHLSHEVLRLDRAMRDVIVRHRNGDTLDCRKENLIQTTKAEQFAPFRALRWLNVDRFLNADA